MGDTVSVNFKGVEVVSKGIRKDKQGKERPWFQVLHRHDKGVHLHFLSGEGVEVGKKYDVDGFFRAHKDQLYGTATKVIEHK